MKTIQDKLIFAKNVKNLMGKFVRIQLGYNVSDSQIYLSNDNQSIVYEWESDFTGYGGSTETHYKHFSIEKFEEYLNNNNIIINHNEIKD